MSINILIVQTDNRTEVDYIGLTKLLNTRTVEYMNNNSYFSNIHYRYEFIHMKESYYNNNHPACGKIFVMDELLNTIEDDIIVFLDTDAWIQNCYYLHDMCTLLESTENKNGCFSRDPYVGKNTYINSGSFLIKVNDFNRNLYKEIKETFSNNDIKHTTWPYDQYYIGDIIFKYREQFIVFLPDILNTSYGSVLRHNWWKNQNLFSDLYELLDINKPWKEPDQKMDFTDKLDTYEYPNPDIHGHEYW
jgi:hypothetical protein